MLHDIVTQGGFFRIGGVIAAGAGLISIPTDFRAGGRLRLMLHDIVAQGGLFCIGGVIAAGAGIIGIPANFRAGSCLRVVVDQVVVQLCLLRIGAVITAGAGIIGIPADFRAGRGFGVMADQVVTQRIAVFLLTDFALCFFRTGGLAAGVGPGFCPVADAAYAGMGAVPVVLPAAEEVRLCFLRTAAGPPADADMVCRVPGIRRPVAPVMVVRVRLAVFRMANIADRPAYAGGRAAGVGLQEEVEVAMVTVRLMPALAAILVVHLMIGNRAVIAIALIAVGLIIAGPLPWIVMELGDLCAAGGAGAGVCSVPVVLPAAEEVRLCLLRAAAVPPADADMVCRVPGIRRPLAPVMVVRVCFVVFRMANIADRPAYAGGRAAGVGLQEEVEVAMVTVRLMPALAAILVVHLMIGNRAVIAIALIAVGLIIAGPLPWIVMELGDLCAAGGAGAGVCSVPVVLPAAEEVRLCLLRAAAVPPADADMVCRVPGIRRPLAPVMVVRVCFVVFRMANIADRPAYAGGRTAGTVFRATDRILVTGAVPVTADPVMSVVSVGNRRAGFMTYGASRGICLRIRRRHQDEYQRQRKQRQRTQQFFHSPFSSIVFCPLRRESERFAGQFSKAIVNGK